MANDRVYLYAPSINKAVMLCKYWVGRISYVAEHETLERLLDEVFGQVFTTTLGDDPRLRLCTERVFPPGVEILRGERHGDDAEPCPYRGCAGWLVPSGGFITDLGYHTLDRNEHSEVFRCSVKPDDHHVMRCWMWEEVRHPIDKSAPSVEHEGA